jgi:signal transduction histidine kinase
MYTNVFQIQKKSFLYLTAFVILVIICFFDYISGFEVASALFYILPIYLIAAHRSTNNFEAILMSIICGICWFVIEKFSGHEFPHPSIIYWNTFVSTVTFIIIAFLLNKNKEEKKEIEIKNETLHKFLDEKNELIGIAAHDLRAPIGLINNLSELCLYPESNQNLTDEQIEYAKIINQTSASSLALLNSLLDYSKVESGIVKLDKKQYDYIGIIKSSIDFYTHFAVQKKQKISLNSEIRSLILTIDKIKIEQVLNNLLSNAVKYSYHNSIITVNVKFDDTQKNVITEIIDQGMGIDEKDLGNLFESFNTTANKPTGGETSTGLGLVIVKKVIMAHGGTIKVDAKKAQGSRFYFYLPVI